MVRRRRVTDAGTAGGRVPGELRAVEHPQDGEATPAVAEASEATCYIDHQNWA